MHINRILTELLAERDRIDRAISVLESLNPTQGASARRLGQATQKTRKLSAAGRARIAAAQRARWAKLKRAVASEPVRGVSLAARNRLAPAQRAKAKGQQQTQKKAA